MKKDRLTKNMKGDIPCGDCGTDDNRVWYTDNVFWNDIMKKEGGLILCPIYFIKRAEKKYKPTGWRLTPSFKWEKQKNSYKQVVNN